MLFQCLCLLVLVLSYSRIANLSMDCITYSGISLGAEDSCSSLSVNSGSTFQSGHGDFLPCPAKLEAVSHPVRAWNTGNARAFLGPRPAAYSWAAMY